MKYERLTNSGKDYTESDAIDRLWDLENKIENGTLIELPCRLGDTVFIIAKQGMDIYSVEETKIVDYWFNKMDNRLYPIDTDGITFNEIFLTKAEAEKRLEELRGEK